MTLAIITRCDVIRAGACASGVNAWLLRCRPLPTAITVTDALSRCRGEDERAYVMRAAGLDGYGDGDGGYGEGDGDGGDGYGDGGYGRYGEGDGYGLDGYGGDGNGDGNGDGYGEVEVKVGEVIA